MLSDHLYYFKSKEDYSRSPKEPLGRIALNSFFCAKAEDTSNYEFTVNAYPKVRIEGRAHFYLFRPPLLDFVHPPASLVIHAVPRTARALRVRDGGVDSRYHEPPAGSRSCA